MPIGCIPLRQEESLATGEVVLAARWPSRALRSGDGLDGLSHEVAGSDHATRMQPKCNPNGCNSPIRGNPSCQDSSAKVHVNGTKRHVADLAERHRAGFRCVLACRAIESPTDRQRSV